MLCITGFLGSEGSSRALPGKLCFSLYLHGSQGLRAKQVSSTNCFFQCALHGFKGFSSKQVLPTIVFFCSALHYSWGSEGSKQVPS
jgi:hypothetical protein